MVENPDESMGGVSIVSAMAHCKRPAMLYSGRVSCEGAGPIIENDRFVQVDRESGRKIQPPPW